MKFGHPYINKILIDLLKRRVPLKFYFNPEDNLIWIDLDTGMKSMAEIRITEEGIHVKRREAYCGPVLFIGFARPEGDFRKKFFRAMVECKCHRNFITREWAEILSEVGYDLEKW